MIDGYIIPKDTHVIPLLYAMHMDPKVWDEPEKFVPERFLKDGKVHKPCHFMPFGCGQRMCLGDKLAEMELQLFFSSLLHVFDIENPGPELPSLQGVTGVTVAPQDFQVRFIPRNPDALKASDIQPDYKSEEPSWNKHVKLFEAPTLCACASDTAPERAPQFLYGSSQSHTSRDL